MRGLAGHTWDGIVLAVEAETEALTIGSTEIAPQ